MSQGHFTFFLVINASSPPWFFFLFSFLSLSLKWWREGSLVTCFGWMKHLNMDFRIPFYPASLSTLVAAPKTTQRNEGSKEYRLKSTIPQSLWTMNRVPEFEKGLMLDMELKPDFIEAHAGSGQTGTVLGASHTNRTRRRVGNEWLSSWRTEEGSLIEAQYVPFSASSAERGLMQKEGHRCSRATACVELPQGERGCHWLWFLSRGCWGPHLLYVDEDF